MKYSAVFATAFAPVAMARFLDMLPGQLDRRTHPEEGKEAWYPSGDEWQGMQGHGITKDSKTEIIIIWANPGNGAATTTINEKVTVTQTVTAGAGAVTEAPKEGEPAATEPAKGASHTVTVGGPGGLVFQPEELSGVPIGDTVIFEFLAQNHTVSQSAFDTPCDILEGGMDSGFMANPNNTVSPPPQVAMQVMVDTPLWFFCKQGNHCGQGMVFSINPTAEKTHAMFKEMAIQQKGEGAKTPITGGEPIAEEPAAEKPAATEQPAAEKPAATEQPAAEKPAATETASAPENTGYVPGKGQLGSDGSCTCVVSCSAGSFPAANVQGLGAFGGMAGGLPMKVAGLK